MTSQGIHEVQIRDTNWYDLPETGGFKTGRKKTLVKIVNGLDQSVTVTLQGGTFEDPDMKPGSPNNKISNDPSTAQVTVNAGSEDVLVTEIPWSYVQLSSKCDTAPTSGSLYVVFQTER